MCVGQAQENWKDLAKKTEKYNMKKLQIDEEIKSELQQVVPPVVTETFKPPVELPTAPTPGAVEVDTKKAAKIRPKKRKLKTRAKGTAQLQTPRPKVGLAGINTGQGVNIGTGTTKKPD